MIGEFERPARLRAAQARALRRYLREQVGPYSPAFGASVRAATADAAGPGDAGTTLARLPLRTLVELTDPGALVLRPTAEALAATPERDLRWRFRWAAARRRQGAFNRDVLEPRYKPIHWLDVGGLPIGYTASDLDTLGEIGRAMLEMAGVAGTDVLVGVQPLGPSLDLWQLWLGASRAGVASLFLGPAAAPDQIARLRPNVIAGRGPDLARLVDAAITAGLSLASVHTLIVLGGPVDPTFRSRLLSLGTGGREHVAVVAAWAPPGVRALWSECRYGVDVHTWPAFEHLEVVDPEAGAPLPPSADGEIVWTPIGWKGTVVPRLRTGVIGCLDDTACVACGRTSPRVRVVPTVPPFARVLDEHPGVALWQAELRTVGDAEELIVFVAPRANGHPGRLVRELDRHLSATQFVVLDRRTLSRRIKAHGERRVVDLRA